jgi:site-specific DNA recombinase
MYAAGISPQMIAKRLNAEGVRGPDGRTWGPSTLHGHAARGTGILNNELYIGRLVWNRQRYVKEPVTGRRVSRPNPASAWVITDVPELRIVPGDLWAAVKARQLQVREAVAAAGNTRHARRPRHLFSGLIPCGSCGRSYVEYSAHRMACSGHRERGICANRLTIRREEIERRVLNALQTRFFASGPFQVFCEEFTAAVNEARMELRAGASSAKRELERVRGENQKVIGAIKAGFPPADLKEEMETLQARKEALLEQLTSVKELPPLLHPNMADLWRAEIAELRDALTEDRCDPEAREAVRKMVEEIRLTPQDGTLAVEVKGNLAAMLATANPTTEDWERQLTLVAGGGFEPPTFGL